MDFYYLSQHTDIAELPGWGKSSYSNLLYAVDNSRNVRLANFIYALGIKNVGRSASAALADTFKTVRDFIDAATDDRPGAAESLLGKAEGVGKLMQADIIAFFKDDKTMADVEELIGEVNILAQGAAKQMAAGAMPAGVPQGSPDCLTGLSFCVTGKIDFPGKRDALISYIESMGGRYNRSVTRGLTYLITNDTSTGTVKNKSAVSLGVKVISEPTFMRLVEELSAKSAPQQSVAPVPTAQVLQASGSDSYDYVVTKEQWEAFDDMDGLSDVDKKWILDKNTMSGWGFTKESMNEVIDEHKEARRKGDYRTMLMMESLLGEANFDTERDYLHDGKYTEAYNSAKGFDSGATSGGVSAVAGKTFCITGKVDFPGKRAALQAYISSLGGYNASSVTNRVDYLITNDTESGSAKNKSAAALGVKVISEDEFLEMAGD